ncbi:zwei Ig domain protein zig-8-like [Macrosteles quadrilineatus]|uniref:zwei Ig domain protein zig-8-like n=1 Tax=Macrosteles quadrilineatus TaxID=74068 RepID=UPI0023E16068|nr:zwei Ig domain protein zig-8-like [Macrosteles quadrilineatus]
MFLWMLVISLWLHIDTAAKSDKDIEEVTVNQLHVVWHQTTSGLQDDVHSTPSADDVTTTPLMPFFEDSGTFVNVTVQFGANALLHCRVHELTDKTTVSWLRREEGQLHLLSVGLDIYAGNTRYTAALLHPNDWTLSVRGAEESDEGWYECQVSSHPPLVHTLYLRVIVPELQIWDERGIPLKNKFYNAGSTIELKCSISKVPKPSHFILWKHGNNILNYDVTRGGISVKTDIVSDGVNSRLYIANVGPQDSGNYTCHLADVAETTVSVHVLNGETPAAMQHGGTSCLFPAKFPLVAILFFLFSTILNSR